MIDRKDGSFLPFHFNPSFEEKKRKKTLSSYECEPAFQNQVSVNVEVVTERGAFLRSSGARLSQQNKGM